MARNGSIFEQQSQIQSILETCDDVKAVENGMYRLLTSAKCSQSDLVMREHVKYNLGLLKVLQIVKQQLGKAIIPTMIVRNLESGGPQFMNLDPVSIATRFQWSSKVLSQFNKLRNDTISIWNKINENINFATVEETECALSQSIIE